MRHTILIAAAGSLLVLALGCGGSKYATGDNGLAWSRGPGNVSPSRLGYRVLRPEGWTLAMDRLATDLVGQLRVNVGRDLKVAVLDFATPTGALCSLSAPAAEALTASLFQTTRFRILERRLLRRVMQENMVSQSDLFDPNQVARLGRLVGVNAMVTGTIGPADTTYDVRARLVSAESGEWLSAAEAVVERRDAEQRGRCRGGLANSPPLRAEQLLRHPWGQEHL